MGLPRDMGLCPGIPLAQLFENFALACLVGGIAIQMAQVEAPLWDMLPRQHFEADLLRQDAHVRFPGRRAEAMEPGRLHQFEARLYIAVLDIFRNIRGLSSSGTENWEVPGKGIRYVVVNRTFILGRSCISI